VFGRFLSGQFAMSQAEPAIAAGEYLKALALAPNNQELVQQAFLAAAMSGRPEAVQLARQLPNNQVAQLVLGDAAARAGHWQEAEQRFRALPAQGLTQLLQPLLVAWAQQGGGHTDAALATLRPLTEGQRFQGVFALHAAMIADLAGRTDDADRFYAMAQADSPVLNLRLARILASWQARTGHPEAARHLLVTLGQAAPDLAIAVPGLIDIVSQRPVTQPTDGIAEAYLALAGALRAQDSGNLATLMLRMALDLRPDLTAARVLQSEVLAGDEHDAAALQMLAAVPATDPLSPLVRLRRAALDNRMGHPDTAMQALETVAKQYPGSPMPLIMEGDIQRAQEHFLAAAATYSRAIAELGQPGAADWGVFYSRGIAYDQAHDWPKAQADFHTALQLSPGQPAVLNYLGYSWANMDENLPQARAMIEQAVERRPNDGAITDSLGWVMLRQGETAGAVKTLERAVELEPEDATINAHLGDAYWAAGRKLEAQYQWRRALTLNPAPEDVAKLEAKLQPPAATKGAVISGQ
jgi:tetratricopeptide (TPR) repeat protein